MRDDLYFHVTGTHPTAAYAWDRIKLRVRFHRDDTFYIVGAGVGCSRDYPASLAPEDGIRRLACEHAVTVTKIEAA